LRDADSTISTPTESQDAGHRFIGARVLAHPDPARVGEFAPLFDATGGGRLALNRWSPDFRAPTGRSSGPLESTRITRNPLHLERSGDELRLSYQAATPALEVDGRPLAGERVLSAAELDAGVVILFGRDLALWLGWLELGEPAPAVDTLVGESTIMRKLRQQIHRVADLEVPVLLRGETGVGKELVAAAIHRHSRRASGSYVAVNLAGVPPTMAASELFGHKRGAFTGAVEEHRGYFAQASGGTLFLDEIGDVAFDVQALLLRAVQERVIQPVGGVMRSVDVRLIAATDSDLESAVARREFREPLLRRFSYEIHVPPLRARLDDVGLLFYRLLGQQLEKMGEADRLIARDREAEPFVPARFVAGLARYDWPGNVRELANVALKFAIENRGLARGRVSADLLRLVAPRRPASAVAEAAAPPGRPAAEIAEAELLATVHAEGFSVERAARRLGVSKSYLYRRLEGNPSVRRAHDIPAEEIRAALAATAGDVPAAAARLRVSTRALRLQVRRAAPTS
jgi:two-component system nitrogen regulation response regulator GlnG